MFPFSHGIREFQAMVDAGLSPLRALRAGTSVAAELLGRHDLGTLAGRGSGGGYAACWPPPRNDSMNSGLDESSAGVASICSRPPPST